MKKFEDEFVGANKKAEQDAEKQVQGELESIRKTAASKKDAVVKLLTEAVSTPNPELPRNIKKVEALVYIKFLVSFQNAFCLGEFKAYLLVLYVLVQFRSDCNVVKNFGCM